VRRVLVTGGSGFIGSHVVDALLRAGIRPRVFDKAPLRHHSPDQVEAVCADLSDPEALDRALRGCEAVIHLAAAADVGIVAEQPREAEEMNSRGTIEVLEAARRAGGVRVVYGSTIWVYGASGDGLLDEDSTFGLPDHLYTASKLAGEMYCRSYTELYGLPTTILRFGIPYGPRARPAAVIPIFVRKALAGEPLTLAGGGAQTREFVYVEDLAEGVVAALDPAAENRVYNLSVDRSVSIRELAETVGDLVGDVEIVTTPGRTGDFGGAEISSERAQRELGWRASTPLAEGVGRYMDWLRAEEAREAVPVREPVAAESGRPEWWPLNSTRTATALACAIGVLIPTLLARRMDEFDPAQVHAVTLTTLVAILISLSTLSTGRRLDWRPTGEAAWLLLGYWTVLVIPWTRHTLTIAVPEVQTLLLSAIATVVAVAVATGADRLRDLAPDRA
jgi:UDP-glucose 4-epimerase